MAQTGVLTRVVSVDGTDWAAAIAQNAGLIVSLPVRGRLGSGVGIVRSIFLQSSVQTAWEINFFATVAGPNADPNVDSFQGRFSFNAADGAQIGGTGLYRYYVDGLTLLVSDADAGVDIGGRLHISLVPRGAGKATFASGELFRLAVTVEVPGGWG